MRGAGGQAIEWKGAFCAVTTPSHRLVSSPAEWAALWREIGLPAPAADLERNAAAAVFLGSRRTGGYSVAFDEPAEEGAVTALRYRVVAPDGMALQALTQPYAVRLFPKSGRSFLLEARAPSP